MKLFLPLLLLLAVTLSGAGCMTDEQSAKLKKQADVDHSCEAGPDCDAKWAAIKNWMEVNTRFEIQEMTDSVMRTYGPEDTADPALTAYKKSNGDGTYTLTLKTDCTYFGGCNPNDLQLQAGFAQLITDTVAASPSSAESPLLGIEVAAQGKTGVVITAVEPRSPGAKGGLRVGDQLLKLNGRPITSLSRATDLLNNVEGSSIYPVQISRGSKQMIIYVQL